MEKIIIAHNPKSKYLTHGKEYRLIKIDANIYTKGNYIIFNDANCKRSYGRKYFTVLKP